MDTPTPPPASPPTSPAASPVIEVDQLHVQFQSHEVLKGVSLKVWPDQLVALIGPNGSGKTTLLRCLLGLQPYHHGTIRLFGETSPSKALGRVGYVPQKLNLDRSFILSVREFLCLRQPSTRGWFWRKNQELDDLLMPHVKQWGIDSLLDRPIAALSGGQLQRVLIAFSLLKKPDLLLMDEPTSGVDTPGEHTFYELITEIRETYRLTIVLVSHDLSMVYRHASWVYALNGEICCEGKPEEVMNAEALKKAYGIHVSPHEPHQHHVH